MITTATPCKPELRSDERSATDLVFGVPFTFNQGVGKGVRSAFALSTARTRPGRHVH